MLFGTRTFWQSATLATLTSVALLAAELVPFARALPGSRTVRLLRRTVTMRGLSAADRESQTAGYYQELLNRASTVVSRTPGAGGNAAGGRPQLEELGDNKIEVNEHLRSFLIYRPLPNLDTHDPRFGNVHYQTNSYGFNDREYPLERKPGTWRIALLGDSMALGLGVEQGAGFDALFERELNARFTSPRIHEFEVINMGVSGFRVTQVADVGLEIAPRFKPDVYVVALSWLSVARKWGLHLAQLVDENIDPKYPYLRQLIVKAGLKGGDSESVTERKLAPYVVPTVRWMLGELRARAKADGAQVVVMLVPHLKGIGSYDAEFDPIRTMLTADGYPTLDLLEAFDDIDPADYDVGDGLHPNAAGHQILHAALEAQLDAHPEVAAILRGRVGQPPRRTE